MGIEEKDGIKFEFGKRVMHIHEGDAVKERYWEYI